jgi:hypothetical protein
MMQLKTMVKIAAGLALIALAYSWLSPPKYTLRYKLTLAVDVGGEIKTAHNVVELLTYAKKNPYSKGYSVLRYVTGEALFLDLGPGRRPLVALLTRKTRSTDQMPCVRCWGEDWPSLERLYNMPEFPSFYETGRCAECDYLAKQRGAREISPNDLPDLVTFDDVSDVTTVLAVEPNNLEATLGAGVKWHRLTLEVTDEPLTTGLEQKLGWIDSYYGYINRATLRHQNGRTSRLNPGSLKRSLSIYERRKMP